MRASTHFPTSTAGGTVLAPRPALRAHSVPPEPVMPPPPPPDLPTGVPPIGDPLPSPAPAPGPGPDVQPDMPPPMQAAAAEGGCEGAGGDRSGAVHHPMIAQPRGGRAPRFERPSVYRLSLLRVLSGRLSDTAH